LFIMHVVAVNCAQRSGAKHPTCSRGIVNTLEIIEGHHTRADNSNVNA
jgi:hypothetical protein